MLRANQTKRWRQLALWLLVSVLATCEPPAAESSSITVEPVVTLGVTNDSGYVGLPSGLARGENSEWFLTQFNAPDAVHVFDSAGRYLRSIGRRGTGPGEFVSTRGVIRTGDTLHVFDQRLLRRTLLTTAGQFISAAPYVGQILEAASLDSGRLVVNTIPRGEGIGHRVLAIMDANGDFAVTFGDTVGERNIDPNRYWRKLAVAPNGTIWSARLPEYRLDQWSASGAHLRAIRIEADWFESHDGSHIYAPDRASGPMIGGIQADSVGRIWVIVHVPDPDRSSAFEADPDSPDGLRFNGDHSALWDTRIAVIDLATEEVLGETTVPEYLSGFADTGIAYAYSLQSDARPRIDVFALRLTSE
jgi:hypothetical protein